MLLGTPAWHAHQSRQPSGVTAFPGYPELAQPVAGYRLAVLAAGCAVWLPVVLPGVLSELAHLQVVVWSQVLQREVLR